VSGWGVLGKGQSSLDQVEARATVRDGVLVTEFLQARSGAQSLAVTGRVNLVDGALDLRLATRTGVPSEQPLKAADFIAPRPCGCTDPGANRGSR